MANLAARDGNGIEVFLGATGAGTNADPLKVLHSDVALQELVDLLIERVPVALSNGKLVVETAASDALLTTVRDHLIEIVGSVNTLEALLTTLNNYSDGLEALLGATNTSIATLTGFVNQLEVYTDDIEANQATQITLETAISTRLASVDFGTEFTLAAILAKLIAAPATEAKQSAIALINAEIRDRLPVPVARTTSLINTSTAGTIAAGANSVAIANFGSAAGTVKGVSLPSGASVNWSANGRDTLDAIDYVATGTNFLITLVV